jgi:prepilin-type N-terminal cleavage/methylation domain-containing protein
MGRFLRSVAFLPRSGGPRPNERGFTLLETLIAMVILAMASGVVLQHVRTIMDYVRRAQLHFRDADRMLNETAEFGLSDFKGLDVIMRDGHIDLARRGESKPVVEVFNLPYGGTTIPIDRAYSPFQLFLLPGEQGRDLPLIMPGLTPPGGKGTKQQ